ncbi:MAG: T9SS type A sorting domain-containing protein [Bacteroidetes bacterium]|nr:T9SS type A sorting domain-containing protein [Bacteroidota bacterium]
MKKMYLFFLICMLPAGITLAQQPKADLSNLDKRYHPTSNSKAVSFSIPCTGFVNNPSADLKWRAIVNPVPIRHSTENNELVERLKAERLKMKLANLNEKSGASENSGNGATPEIGANFGGNQCNGSSPLDNCIAISNDGIIVSVSNTTIFYTNSQGQVLYYKDLLTFIGDATIQGVCDPVILYDATVDRFVFFCQVSPLSSSTSKLLVFFSGTNNPADGWHYYKLSGNPLNDGSAFDYPKLAYSNNELYITGNLFRDSDGKFNQAVLYQITKGPAFSGGTINFTVWHNIEGSPFTLCPLSYGQQGSYGPGCYLVATSSSDDNKFSFYDLTDDFSTGLAQLKYYSISTQAYQVAPDALQPGTTVKLNTNDARTLGGFYLNKMVHFVFNSVWANNYCGINYNRLDLTSGQNTSVTFGLDGADYCYPSVASSGVSSTDQAVLIGFQKSTTTSYPSVRVVECDNTLAWSGSVEVRPGDNYVYYTGDPERWGDYSGIYRKYNASRPTCWMSGAYGGSDNKWATYIAEVFDNSNGIASLSQTPAMNVYPNPVIDIFSLEFSLAQAGPLTINIMDANGKLVKQLYEGKGYSGKNILSFNKANLKPGIYFIVLISDKTILKNEKIVIGS